MYGKFKQHNLNLINFEFLFSVPNSPLAPLTPLSENTAFDFNFGGDGSLDMYIESVRQEHRIEQQQKKLLQQANKTYNKTECPKQPKRYSEEFLKIRHVFEVQELKQEQIRSKKTFKAAPNRQICPPTVKITHTGASPIKKILTTNQRTPTHSKLTSTQKMPEYVATPTNVRTPRKHRNQNICLNLPSKSYQIQQNQKIPPKSNQQHRRQTYRQASPVAAKPLCPHVGKILQRSGLAIYSGLFQREEIDLFTFKFIRLQDLHQMGITNPKHCELIMADVYYAEKYY